MIYVFEGRAAKSPREKKEARSIFLRRPRAENMNLITLIRWLFYEDFRYQSGKQERLYVDCE